MKYFVSESSNFSYSYSVFRRFVTSSNFTPYVSSPQLSRLQKLTWQFLTVLHEHDWNSYDAEQT